MTSPTAEQRFYVISYDIVEDRIRHRVMKLLKGFGFHVQKSVFECILTDGQIRRLRDRLQKLINQDTDSVRIYRLCGECRHNVEILGRGEISDLPLVEVV
ncbi:MAG: CRISPR-associated endonuclease Cas2 [Calditrichaeota bacterium]|nr:MAG: CRISPR-associated endonuclease Cas2 [Calditrichota bacterium]